MKFLIDRCAGRRLADWLRANGHDVVETRDLGPDPGDAALLQIAVTENRVLVSIDTDFGTLIFVGHQAHSGIIRLPDVPADRRIQLVEDVLLRHTPDLEAGAIVTVRGGRIRISKPPSASP